MAITETWLSASIRSAELLSTKNYHIHCRDREATRRAGGALLAMRSLLQSIRRAVLETSSELLVCEIRPEFPVVGILQIPFSRFRMYESV